MFGRKKDANRTEVPARLIKKDQGSYWIQYLQICQ